MSLTPFSRENMLSLKLQKDEEGYNLKLDSIVKQIYTRAVYFAEINAKTAYQFCIDTQFGCINIPSSAPSSAYSRPHQQEIYKEFVIENMSKILLRLESLFPDCSVQYKKISLAIGRDGKEYDISTLDDKVRPFIDTNRARTNEYIVIDWS